MRKSGAQHLADVLSELGVDVVFGLPGVHNLPIWEALAGTSIRVIGVRHCGTRIPLACGLTFERAKFIQRALGCLLAFQDLLVELDGDLEEPMTVAET